jgi:alkylation response protein AidB-like acyl-CoA dehydrogenase
MTHSTSRITAGRADLAAWKAAQPTNFFRAEPLLEETLALVAPEGLTSDFRDRLDAHGAACATELDEAATVNNRPWNLPRLERFDAIGNRTEEIENHPSYHVAGRVIYESGLMGELAGEGGLVRSLALFALSSMCGEAAHNCPVACTAGIISSLSAVGSPELRATYLPGLLSRSYATRLDGAQFLTEVQGGSDVGAGDTRALPLADGSFAIHGEKWFCSNAGADLILMTARYPDGPEGTAGLGLFLVAKTLPGGAPNHFAIRRLKDKLGTRSMPSGEIDFQGAIAHSVGPLRDGFKTVMRYVINLSRIYNAIAVTGAALRAASVAASYARHRRAFGGPIADYASVIDLVAAMRSDAAASLVATLALAPAAERAMRGTATAEEQAFVRFATNLNKVVTARLAVETTLRGIETLGGNGAIESFSIMPRLHRDMIVCENWEGTPNVLCAQIARDLHRGRIDDAYFAHVRARFAALTSAQAKPLTAAAPAAIDKLAAALDATRTMPHDRATLAIKRLSVPLAALWYAAELARLGEHNLATQKEPWALQAALHLWNRHLGPTVGAIAGDEYELARAVAAL